MLALTMASSATSSGNWSVAVVVSIAIIATVVWHWINRRY